MRKKATITHEHVCFYNPSRTPREGELAIFDNIPGALLVDDSYGVPGSDFKSIIHGPYSDYEKIIIKPFMWWPFTDDYPDLGYVWLKGKWEKIKGYRYPNLAPGYSFKDEIIPDEFYSNLYDRLNQQ